MIASWLLDLTAARCFSHPRWTTSRAGCRTPARAAGRRSPRSKKGYPPPVLLTALFSRFGSRDLDQFANQVLSAMRKQFGGHVEKSAG